MLDLSEGLLTPRTVALLCDLARATGVPERIEQMLSGARINTTEDRPVLHVALRAERGTTLLLDGEDVVAPDHDVLDRMASFADAVRDGTCADAAQVLARAADDPVAADVWAQALRAACACAVGLAHLYCPQRLVVGGGLGRHAPGLLEALRVALDEGGPRGMPAPVAVGAAELGDDAGLVGAAGWQDARPAPPRPSGAADGRGRSRGATVAG